LRSTPKRNPFDTDTLAAGEVDPDISRSEFAYQHLIAAIRSGELRPGQRMRETELASLLNVSRTPVREAIRRLNSEGLVVLAGSRGMTVAELDKQQVRELYALRATLEGSAARLAAQHASPDELAAMREFLLMSPNASAEENARINRLFHQAIHEASHNRYLERSLAQMSDWLALLPGTTYQVAGRPAAAHVEHSAILAAIEGRAPEEAERLARHHIEMASATRLRMMFASA
jgi:DNA-binding GntR family transcriptional regulator